MSHDAVPIGEAILLRQARDKYRGAFDSEAVVAACAPGRVNLIGEHVDYCEGYVLPVGIPLKLRSASRVLENTCHKDVEMPGQQCHHAVIIYWVSKAIPFLTVIVGGYNNTDECQILSILSNGESVATSFPSTTVAKLTPGPPAWSNYIKGTVDKFPKPVRGFNATIVSDVPMGSGLSSSASVEVAVFTFLEELTGQTVDQVEKARRCQSAEHEFPGMPCGIMDQYIVAMAKKDHALLIDCRSYGSTQIPVKIGDAVILVTNSNVKHQLTGSEYPQRRAQCEEAARKLGLPSLRMAKIADLDKLKKLNCDELVLKRAQHIIEEIARTAEVAKRLRENDLQRVGQLFYESHESLSNLMEVSCPELDQLVDIIRTAPGVFGARMTGGGFGGCVVTLVKSDEVDNLKKLILSKYQGNPVFFVCQPSEGAKGIKL